MLGAILRVRVWISDRCGAVVVDPQHALDVREHRGGDIAFCGVVSDEVGEGWEVLERCEHGDGGWDSEMWLVILEPPGVRRNE
jgi:hypothetical protein